MSSVPIFSISNELVMESNKEIRIITIGDKESNKKKILCDYGDKFCTESTPYDFPPTVLLKYETKQYNLKLR
jgi:hypothetical protein